MSPLKENEPIFDVAQCFVIKANFTTVNPATFIEEPTSARLTESFPLPCG
jgi:hypothetical protein